MNTNSNAFEALKRIANYEGGTDYTCHTGMRGIAKDALASITNTTTEDGDICDGCGTAYESVFRVPDEVWSQIAPKPDSLGEHIEHQYGGLLCLNCADNAAREAGITLVWDTRLNWDDATEDGLAGELEELIEKLKGGVPCCDPDHGNGEGLFAVEDANDFMFEAAKMLTALSPSPSGDEPLTISREPTDDMVQAGLYQLSVGGDEFAMVHQIWVDMFDSVTSDGGCTPSLPASPSGDVVERPEGCTGTMPASRIIYFLERFKGEEKWLGPHEQWAIDSAIAALTTPHTSDALLREALIPFAAKAIKRDEFAGGEPDSKQITHRLGDFRAAQKALEDRQRFVPVKIAECKVTQKGLTHSVWDNLVGMMHGQRVRNLTDAVARCAELNAEHDQHLQPPVQGEG